MLAYAIAIATYAAFFMILALGLNLQWGMTGLVNFGVAGFYAIGAYASAIIATRGGWPPEFAILAAMVVTAAVGAVVGMLARRLREDYFAIVTLGFAELARLVILNEDWLTEGPRGLKMDARPFDFGFDQQTYAMVYLTVVMVVVAAIYLLCERLKCSPYGRVLRAIRADDVVTGVLGKNVFRFRVQVFAIGCGFMGVAGALYGHFVQNISPETFMPMISIFIWMSVIVGGYGNNRGLLVGAGFVMLILEGSRFLGDVTTLVSTQQISSLRVILIGAILIIVLRYRPRGLMPEARFISPFERRN
jgi:branched-chain amino acid transport system permease protein